ncbi:MAG: nickel-dependent hydrogenase large subunit [Coriobacteriales bacterium]|nr:nickel-dependent hydrogenase large subunit [Coriobacteriales bacterium]
MARSTIDPITRIEGHLRVEMEVTDGVVSDAWVSGGLFRGMELILEGRQSQDASLISQRICGVCPVSHCHASCLASEHAMGITPPEGGRLVRNLVEGSQFIHSSILWFYTLNGLDYVNPINGLGADIASCYDACQEFGLAAGDFANLQKRLAAFAENGQLSIFSGNWFETEDADGTPAYKLTPELDLIATQHYIEALEMQAKASEISGIIGGKMPHIMTSLPGGTMFVPTAEKLDDIYYHIVDLERWINNVLIPDALALSKVYAKEFGYGMSKDAAGYVAWGVLDDKSFEMNDRYLPAGVITRKEDGGYQLDDVDSSLITEDIKHSYYKDSEPVNPLNGITDPWYPEKGYDVDDKYSWSKSPRYNGKPYEAGPLSRMLSAYLRGRERVVELIDSTLETLSTEKYIGQKLEVPVLESTFGRAAARALEMVYIIECMKKDCLDLIQYVGSGQHDFYTKPTNTTGTGEGMWEAPRGAIYHMDKLENDVIKKYQIIIPSTWNISPRDRDGVRGPMESALIGVEVTDIEKPIHALRVVHSFDPCTACAVHIVEPKTGRQFSSVESPWGVR